MGIRRLEAQKKKSPGLINAFFFWGGEGVLLNYP